MEIVKFYIKALAREFIINLATNSFMGMNVVVTSNMRPDTYTTPQCFSHNHPTLRKEMRMVQYVPDVTITSDFIAGFPGETEEQFQRMLDAMEELELDYSNTAAYSPREKTVAAKWTDLYIDEDVKTERLARLNEKNRECCLKSNQKYLGRELEVLIENFEGVNNKGISVVTGRTRNNKIVHIPYDKDITGEFVNVKITKARTWYLNGELID